MTPYRAIAGIAAVAIVGLIVGVLASGRIFPPRNFKSATVGEYIAPGVWTHCDHGHRIYAAGGIAVVPYDVSCR